MSARATAVRRALYTLADALADYLEAESARPALPSPEASNDARPPEPNPEIAQAFARRELKKHGWAQPSKRRGAG